MKKITSYLAVFFCFVMFCGVEWATAQTHGQLVVTIEPQEVIDAGAQWRMDEGTWLGSGEMQTVLVGQYTVEFKDVQGWTKPDNRIVAISEARTTLVTGNYIPQIGSLEVTIIPQGAIDAGAQWRRVGTNVWHDSGTTETEVFVGQHTIEFKEAPGWTKPGDQWVTISEGQTTTASGTYIYYPSGSLRVTMSPQGAINAGAQWRRVGTGIWRNTGTTEPGIPIGQHTVEFKEVPSWTKPDDQNVTISEGQTTTASGTYVYYPSGSLRVTISPQEAIDAGAQWRVDRGTWHGSGETQTRLSLGLHTIEFSTVSGWTKPANRTLRINKDETAAATGTYLRQTGSLRVTISPQGAIDAGAQWRRVGSDAWRNSGTTETGVPVGQHTIEFKDVSGWITPDHQTVMVSHGRTATVTGAYNGWFGSLRVTIGPQEAVNAGAQWRRVGTSTWRNSGFTEAGIAAGQHSVEFKDVSGWAKPDAQTVTISEGQTTAVTGTYTAPTGSLRVTINPQAAIDAGAQWRVDGGTWHASGETQTGLSVGYHTVSFSSVAGWTRPGNRTIKISMGQTATVTGTYALQSGYLK